MVPHYTSTDAIFASLARVPFERSDLEVLRAYKDGVAGTSRDITFHPWMAGELAEAAREGFFVLQVPAMEADVLFVKVDAGRGFFGGRKQRVACYIGAYPDELMPAPLFNSLAAALAGLNNIQRSIEKKVAAAGW